MPTPKIRHQPRGLLGIALVLCLAVQLAGILFAPRNEDSEWDPFEYATLAKNLYKSGQYGVSRGDFPSYPNWAGENPSRMRQPLYPLFLVFSYWMPGASLRLLQISQLLLNLGTLWCVLVIARRIFGGELWVGTALALALYFPLWFTSAFMLSESLFMFLLAVSMLFLWKSVAGGRKTLWFPALAGGLVGLSYLTRPVGIVVCVGGLLLLFFCHGARKGALHALVMLGAFAIVILPWAWRNYVALGEFTPFPTDAGINLFQGTFPQKSQEWIDLAVSPDTVRRYGYYISQPANQRFQQLALERIRNRPLGYVANGVLRVARMWGHFPGSFAPVILRHRFVFVTLTVIHFCILLAAILGLSRVEALSRAFLLLPATCLTLPIFLMTIGNSRFVLPAMPYLLVLAAQGAAPVVHDTVQWVGRKLRPVASLSLHNCQNGDSADRIYNLRIRLPAGRAASQSHVH